MSWRSRIDRLGRSFGRPTPGPICPTCGGTRCGSGRVLVEYEEPEVLGKDSGSKLCSECGLPVTATGRAAITNPGQDLVVVKVCFEDAGGVWNGPSRRS
jgi:hypothetical protein